ncbi:MAG: tetratricopeptide repeat protein [Vampirovibrionales bacterium]|jgi:predicted Zn-dependent protease
MFLRFLVLLLFISPLFTISPVFTHFAVAGTQAEELAKRATMYLKQGQVNIAEKLAKDAVAQSNTLDEQARSQVTLALVEAKLGKSTEAQKRLQVLLKNLPNSHAMRPMASQALTIVSQTGAMKQWQAAKPATQKPASSNDYFDYAITPGNIIHWNVAKMPLNVYIQTPPAEFAKRMPDYNNFVLKAINEWKKAEPRLQFRLVASEKQSDIRVKWKKMLEHNRIGESPNIVLGGKLVLADLVLATHTPTGEILDTETLYLTIVHEFGHVLGVHGHSPNEEDIMYWQASKLQKQLTSRDLATMKRLYQTTPTYTNDASTTMASSRVGAANLLMAQQFFKKQQYQEALAKLNVVFANDPNNMEAYMLAGLCNAKLQNYERAVPLYERAVKPNDKDPLKVYDLAVLTLKRAEQRGQYHNSYKADIQKSLQILTSIEYTIEAQYKGNVADAIQFCQKELDRLS